jgi:UPF0716 protein FxsA
MRLFPVLILLGFPALEIYFLVRIAHEIGWWTAVWLLTSAVIGAALVREAGMGLPARLVAALQQGQPVLNGLMDSGRTVIAGLLFIFPGVISDIMAVAILLLPLRTPFAAQSSVASDGVINGEFRRINENGLPR